MRKIISIALLSSSLSFSADYGSAGCGLGSMVFGSGEGMEQILAATTNASSYSQLFGITSGTSNCASGGVAMDDMQQEYFAEANFESIQQEIVQGHGENLNTLASLFGQDSEQFSVLLRDEYQRISADNAQELVANIRQVLKEKQS